jgi:predicted tellurium resistance membrane protein TerC
MDYEIILSLVTLIALEIILGIDNIIFISILAYKLPPKQRKKARRYGLIMAALLRIGLLSIISWIMKFEKDLFEVAGRGFSVKDLILMAGGLFLLYKSTREIYHKMEGEQGDTSKKMLMSTFSKVLLQIIIMDLVFSIDSIITAIGVVREVWVMYVSVIASVALMLFTSEPIGKFINKHPAFKMLALCFLLMIGFALVSEAMGLVIPKGYIYFSMAFAFMVDMLQMKMNRKKAIPPVNTREHYLEEEERYPKDIL